MLLPLAGFSLSVTFISVMAVVVLGFTKRPPFSILSFGSFIASGMLGGILYAFIYGRVIAVPMDGLGFGGFLVGGPVFATIAGWLGASVVVRWSQKKNA